MARQPIRKIGISKDQEKQAIEELIKYFETERQEEIGNMESLQLLTYILEKIGPMVYNQAILDSQKYMNDKVEDLYGLMF